MKAPPTIWTSPATRSCASGPSVASRTSRVLQLDSECGILNLNSKTVRVAGDDLGSEHYVRRLRVGTEWGRYAAVPDLVRPPWQPSRAGSQSFWSRLGFTYEHSSV